MFKIIGADQKEYGPVSTAQIRQWITDGRLNAATRAQREGTTDWQPLSAFEEFADLFGVAPAPTPAAGAPAAGVGAGATPKRSANSSKAESGCQSVVPSRCARVAAFKRPSVIHWRICAVDTGPYSFWSAPMILNISVVFWGDLVHFMVPTAID